jgi:RNAse (barnase) inhibitor barstar
MSAAEENPKPVGELPPQAVRSLGGYDVETLRRWADQNGQRFVLVECSGCVDRKSVLQAVGRAFAFPEWYGANLDALYDCLTELPERAERGWLVVLERLPRAPDFGAADRDALLDVFRDAAEDFARQRVALRVFYA